MTMRQRVASLTVAGLLVTGSVLELTLPPSRPASPGADARTRQSERRAMWATRDTAWVAHVAVVDEALARADISAAVQAWHDAYGAALAAGSWEAMLSVGDAVVRVGQAAEARMGARPNARQAYLTALLRAQRDGSVDGVLRIAEAFHALGDRAVALQCARLAIRIAEAQVDAVEMERARTFTATRLGSLMTTEN